MLHRYREHKAWVPSTGAYMLRAIDARQIFARAGSEEGDSFAKHITLRYGHLHRLSFPALPRLRCSTCPNLNGDGADLLQRVLL